VPLGTRGEVARPGRDGGSAEEGQRQAGRDGHDGGPHPRRPPGRPGSTGVMRAEGGDRGPLADELRRRRGGTGGVEEPVERGELGTGQVAADHSSGLSRAEAVDSSRTHRI